MATRTRRREPEAAEQLQQTAKTVLGLGAGIVGVGAGLSLFKLV